MNKYFLGLLAVVFIVSACKKSDKKTAANNISVEITAKVPDATQTLTTIAFGSCSNQREPQPLWQPILANTIIRIYGYGWEKLNGSGWLMNSTAARRKLILLAAVYRCFPKIMAMRNGLISQNPVHAYLI